VKGLDAQPVARYEKALSAGVPYGEGKHASKVLYTVRPIFFVQVNDGFRVAVGAVLVTQRLQLLPQGGMVVDFAVENNPDRAVFVAEGLVAGREIDNTKPSHADSNGSGRIDSLVVRSAMDHGGTHPPESLRLNPRASELHDPGDAAHLFILLAG